MNIEHIQFNKRAVKAGLCLSEGWELIKPNYWLFFGISLLAIVVSGCGLPVISWIVTGPVLVGIYFALLAQMRGEQVEFSMMFKGFSRFVPAMIAGFLISIPGAVGNTYRWGFFIAEMLAIYNPNDLTMGMTILMSILRICVGFFVLIGSFIFLITLVFSFPLIAEHNLDVMDTIKLSARAGWSNAGGIFVLAILNVLIFIAGFLALCIGLFFVLPLIYATITIAYRQVFPGPKASFQQTPPAPGVYGDAFGQGS